MTKRDECEHGSLRRSCEICERDETIQLLRDENDLLRRRVIELQERLASSRPETVTATKIDRRGIRSVY